MDSKRNDVIPTFPERGHLNVDDVETVIEVLTEATVPYLLPQVPVGGRDDAHIHVDSLGAADPSDLSLLDDPQQLDLEIHVEFSNLIQKQSALVGQLKKAGFSLAAGAGEGSILIAEQLRFKQRSGNGTAVDFDDRLVPADAGAVDQVDDDLLSRPGLAGDEQGGVHLSNGFNGIQNMPHFFAVRHEAGTCGLLALDEIQLADIAFRHHTLVLQFALQIVELCNVPDVDHHGSEAARSIKNRRSGGNQLFFALPHNHGGRLLGLHDFQRSGLLVQTIFNQRSHVFSQHIPT